jgi:hypothetical protein
LVAGVTHDIFGDFGVSMFAFAIIPLPIALLSLWAIPPKREAEVTAAEPAPTIKLPSRSQLPHAVAPRHAKSA